MNRGACIFSFFDRKTTENIDLNKVTKSQPWNFIVIFITELLSLRHVLNVYALVLCAKIGYEKNRAKIMKEWTFMENHMFSSYNYADVCLDAGDWQIILGLFSLTNYPSPWQLFAQLYRSKTKSICLEFHNLSTFFNTLRSGSCNIDVLVGRICTDSGSWNYTLNTMLVHYIIIIFEF